MFGPPGNVARPADDFKVNSLLSSLKSLQIEDEISNRPDRLSDFQVDDASGTEVVIADSGGKILAEGIFGKRAPDYIHSFFRYPKESRVYLSRGFGLDDLGKVEAEYWLSRSTATADNSNLKPPATHKTK